MPSPPPLNPSADPSVVGVPPHAAATEYRCDECEKLFIAPAGSPAEMEGWTDMPYQPGGYGLSCPWCTGWAKPTTPILTPGAAVLPSAAPAKPRKSRFGSPKPPAPAPATAIAPPAVVEPPAVEPVAPLPTEPPTPESELESPCPPK